MKNNYKAMVLSCMDPRFQSSVVNYLKKKRLNKKYSAFTIAGAAIGVTHNKFKLWHKTFFDNLEISISIHKINRLIIINHEDCGAAKLVNKKKKLNRKKELEIHKISFNKIKRILNLKFPDLQIELYIMSLNKKIREYTKEVI